MDEETPAVTSGTPVAGQHAGFWIRFGAWVIDFVVLGTVGFTMLAVWLGLEESLNDATIGYWVYLINLLIGAAYYTGSVSIWSTTIGKRVFGLYILRADGTRVGVGRAFARFLAGFVSALYLGIGYLMIGLRRDKRGLHDLICDTAVVRGRPQRG